MIVQSASKRLVWSARVCRLFPPMVAGRLAGILYPDRIALREDAAFVARSSLGRVIFRSPGADFHATPFAVRGFFEYRNVVIANTVCRPGDTIIEVGSNVGTETLLFAERVGERGKVVAFEPVPANCAVLRDLIRENRLSQIDLHEAAVADAPGMRRFLPPKSEWSSGTGHLAGQSDGGAFEVPCRTLDELYEAGEWGTPRLLVMDVEGAEALVLAGARRMMEECRPYVVMEYNPAFVTGSCASPMDPLEFLESRGYRNWMIVRWGLKAANPERASPANWVCIPAGRTKKGDRTARRIHCRLIRAFLMPVVRGLNPAVVPNPH